MKLRFTSAASILVAMSELDEFWSDQLTDAAEQARSTGRADVADFLSLKAENDAVRSASIANLFDSIIAAAMSDEYRNKNILIEREAPHSFLHRNANLVGSLIRLRLGVRCMTVEAGWTRTPSDGFMRLQALAFARISHFGIQEANMELVLQTHDPDRQWKIVRREAVEGIFAERDIDTHIAVLIGD